MPTAQRGYRDHPEVANYLRFFPQRVRDRDADEPAREEWWAWRGHTVHLDRLANPSAPVKLVVLHGGGGYGRMVLPYARLLTTPVEVVAPDLPGYGLTRTDGRPVDYGTWVDCAAELVERERARDGRPVVLFGASMGGMLAYSAAARAGAAGVIVTCLLDVRQRHARAAVARFPVLGRLAGPRLLTMLRVVDAVRMPIKWLAKMSAMANQPELNAVVAADRFGGGRWVSVRFLRTWLASAPPIEPEEFTAAPLLMAHPAEDRWTPPEVSLPFFRRLATDTQLVMLPQAGHMPIEEPALAQLTTSIEEFLTRVI